MQAQGREVEFVAVLGTIQTLMEVARPLSPPLRQHLTPWLHELQRRQQQLLVDLRRVNARHRDNHQGIAAPHRSSWQ